MNRICNLTSRRDFIKAAGSALLLQSVKKNPSLPSTKQNAVAKPSEVSPIRFREIARQAGLDFVLQNSPTPRKHMIETMPGGIAAFDYNNDGLTDIFFTNGASLPSPRKDSPKCFNRPLLR